MAAPTVVQMSMEDFFAPCVYAWRRNGEWLYVGKSINGLARLGSSHQVISAHKVRPHDELLIFRVERIDDLKDLENGLIRANFPLHNKQGKGTPPQDEESDDEREERERKLGYVSRSLLQWVDIK